MQGKVSLLFGILCTTRRTRQLLFPALCRLLPLPTTGGSHGAASQQHPSSLITQSFAKTPSVRTRQRTSAEHL